FWAGVRFCLASQPPHPRSRGCGEGRRTGAGRTPLELGSKLWIRRLVRGEAGAPVALEQRAGFAGVPTFVRRLRYLERRVFPAQRLARQRDFLLAQCLAVRELGAGAVG